MKLLKIKRKISHDSSETIVFREARKSRHRATSAIPVHEGKTTNEERCVEVGEGVRLFEAHQQYDVKDWQ